MGCRRELAELSDVPELDRFTLSFFLSLSLWRFVPFVGEIGGFEFKSVPTPDVSFSDIET
jgi:hypothetical protein